jgi:hypothetical protein
MSVTYSSVSLSIWQAMNNLLNYQEHTAGNQQRKLPESHIKAQPPRRQVRSAARLLNLIVFSSYFFIHKVYAIIVYSNEFYVWRSSDENL